MMSQWCEEHWKPYATDRANGIQASLLLMQRLLEDDSFIQVCHGKTELINEEITKIGHVCCYLGDEIMEEIFKECLNDSNN